MSMLAIAAVNRWGRERGRTLSRSEIADDILEMLADGPLTGRQIRERGIPEHSVEDAIKALLARGAIEVAESANKRIKPYRLSGTALTEEGR